MCDFLRKKKYIRPSFEVFIINHESSISAGSAKIITGSGSYQPQVEDWTEGGTLSSDTDM